MWITVLQFIFITLLAINVALKYHYNYWKRKKIPYVTSNILDLDWFNLPMVDFYSKIYRRLKGHKFGGFYMKFAPKLMICDSELIKRILIKDFEFFYQRGGLEIFDESEPITMHIFGAHGPLWRKLRTKLTPTFTSGKMKYMFSLVEECAKELSEEISKQIEINNTIDMKEFTARYTIEVISSCAFGLKARTIQDGSSIFRSMALSIFDTRLYNRLSWIIGSAFPWLKNKLGLRLFNKSAINFFYKLTQDLLHHRENNAVSRNDFFQLLINMRDCDGEQHVVIKKQDQDKLIMTNELMTAQSFLFFIAGFDSSSMVLNGALFELALHTDVQRRVQHEIDEYLQKYDQKITYEMVHCMPYLNQVVSEALRKYPIVGSLSRVCAKNYQIPNSEVVIEKGTEVLIPIAGLHSDSEYFPNPELFDPDRFKDPCSYLGRNAYLPFGDGPRNCIGSRFGQMTVKLALVYLLRDFNFESCSMTRNPLEYKPFRITTSVKHEIFLKCRKK